MCVMRSSMICTHRSLSSIGIMNTNKDDSGVRSMNEREETYPLSPRNKTGNVLQRNI